MAIGYLDSTYLTSIGNAIREKNDTQNTYTPSQMPQAIRDIPSPPQPYKHVTFIDYDGEIVGTYTREEALALTQSPTPPSHLNDELPLVFEDYNWTLQEIKQQLTDHPALPIIAGATYHSPDGYTHALCSVPAHGHMVAYMTYPGSIQWGDGRTTEAVEGETFYYNNYNEAGDYHIIIDSDCVGFKGNGRSYTPRKISFAQNVQLLNGFADCWQIEAIPFTNDISFPNFLATQGLTKLKAFVIPKSDTYNNQQFALYGLKVLSVPPDFEPQSFRFSNLRKLEHFAFPYNYPSMIDGLDRTSLTDIVIPGSKSSVPQPDGQITPIWKRLYIEEGVTRFSYNATLYYTNCLEEIHFPSTMTFIGEFQYATGATIYCLAQTPPTLTSIGPMPAVIYIPYGTTSAYESAQYWSDWAGKYEELPQ